ncbi:transposase, partial [Lachnospiraceae bacterium PH1-22]
MAMNYTEEQLNNFDKATLVQLFLVQQDQLKEIDNKLQILIEQVAVLNNKKFGSSSEKLTDSNQLSFTEINGEIVLFFNEAEVLADEEAKEQSATKTRSKKRVGKRAEDLKNLPKVLVEHKMTEEELREAFGEDSWKQLPDEVYSRYKFTPAKVEVEEHHVAVYASKKTDKMVKADHPGYLLRNSLVSPSLEAAIMNGKYVNGAPFARMEKEFERYGLPITRQNMANWTIHCGERYLAIIYDYLHERLLEYHVIQ